MTFTLRHEFVVIGDDWPVGVPFHEGHVQPGIPGGPDRETIKTVVRDDDYQGIDVYWIEIESQYR